MKLVIFANIIMFQRYVAWNRHETNQGEYDFSGENDVIAFIKMVQEFGMLAIVRPGETSPVFPS